MGAGRLNTAITQFIEQLKVGDRLKNKSVEFSDDLEKSYDDVFVDLLKHYGIDDIASDKLTIGKHTRGSGRQAIGVLLAIPAAIVGTVGGILGLLRPIQRELEYEVDKKVTSARLDPQLATIAYQLDLIDREQFANELLSLGYDDYRQSVLISLNKQRASINLLQLMKLRDVISDEEFNSRLLKLGIPIDELEFYYQQLHIIPNVNDQIMFAVREAYDDSIADRFSYDENFPHEVLEFTRKQGLSDADTLRYWRSHWQLPSPQQAIEMFQRLRTNRTNNPFTDEDLDTYLRIADIAPRFRDWFKQISYNPPTRVDVRRFVEEGIVSQEEGVELLLDTGETRENAERIVQLGLSNRGFEQKTLTRSAIQRMYKKKVFTREEAYTRLLAIGESEETASNWLLLIDLELSEEAINDELDRIEFEYVNGLLNESTVHDQLGRLSLPSEETQRLLRNWDIKRSKKIQLPTKSDYEDWYMRDIISGPIYQVGMIERGYRHNDVVTYQRNMDIEKAEIASKESERAAKEAERTRNDASTTQYKIASSDFDAQIAEANAAIASIKVTLYDVEDTIEQRELKKRILEIQEYVASLRLQKAQTKLDFETARQ